MHVDDSACNLASLNLMKFRRADGSFDVAGFEHAVDIVLLAQEIVVGPVQLPDRGDRRQRRRFRQLGLGYANLGAFLMSNGMPYDSDEGRAVAAAITALMTGRGYRKSAESPQRSAPTSEYEKNREPHNGVMRMHRDAAYEIPDGQSTTRGCSPPPGGLGRGRRARRRARLPQRPGDRARPDRHDQLPDGLRHDRHRARLLAGQVQGARRRRPDDDRQPLGAAGAARRSATARRQIEQIVAYVNEKGTIVGAPGLEDEHLPVFDVAVGERAISHMGHIEMMSATQPFSQGAISKTVNLPETATVADIADAYIEGWKGGLKALAIYRDGSKTAQALRTDAQEAQTRRPSRRRQPVPVRRRMPAERQSITHKFSIAGQEGYITAGKYEDGSVGEIFLTDIGKEGSTLRGMMNAFATAVSIGLQYGVPLEVLVNKFSYMRFDPEGMTKNQEIPFAKSMPDYIMRWLASRFIEDADVHEDLGILTEEVRARKDAQQALFQPRHRRPGERQRQRQRRRGPAGSEARGDALTDTPPVVPGADVARARPRPRLRAVRRDDAADGQLLHLHVAAATTPAAAEPSPGLAHRAAGASSRPRCRRGRRAAPTWRGQSPRRRPRPAPYCGPFNYLKPGPDLRYWLIFKTPAKEKE